MCVKYVCFSKFSHQKCEKRMWNHVRLSYDWWCFKYECVNYESEVFVLFPTKHTSLSNEYKNGSREKSWKKKTKLILSAINNNNKWCLKHLFTIDFKHDMIFFLKKFNFVSVSESVWLCAWILCMCLFTSAQTKTAKKNSYF